jgi:hypothetical protein
MRILYTSDYRCPNVKRRREIRSVINCNVRNKYIDKIVILWEHWDKYCDEEEYSYLRHPKIEVVNWTKRQSYKDFYEHSLQNYPNDIIIVSNSDIIFDHTINRVNELTFNSRIAYALTRYQFDIPNKDKSIYIQPLQGRHDQCWSYDTYIWRHPLDIIPETIDINVGMAGCDTYLVKKLVIENLIEVKNPMIDIRCWHRDFRQDEGLDKDYGTAYRYWDRIDYPMGSRNIYKTGIQDFSGIRGLDFLPIGDGDRFILQSNPVYKHSLKVIAFSLYGTTEKYLKGALKNAEMALDIYPEWDCWYYINKDVPQEVIIKLKEYPNVKIIIMNELILPMTWRFLPLDNPFVDFTICRDTDSIVSERERSCVEEWMVSGKRFHIIRDHPHHGDKNGLRMMGGMIGFKRMPYFNGWGKILEQYKNRTNEWGIDLRILQENIYPIASKYNDIYVSATFHKIESCSKDIPIPYNENFEFIGEYFSETEEGRVKEHIDVIKKRLSEGNISLETSPMKVSTILINTLKDDESLNKLVQGYANIVKNKAKIIINRLKSIDDIPPNYIIHLANIYIPCIANYEGCLMVCPDNLVPIRESFIFDIPKRFDNDRFVSYFNKPWYNIAEKEIWQKVFDITGGVDFETYVRKHWENRIMPDQLIKSKINQFRIKTGCSIELDVDYLNYRTSESINDSKIYSDYKI